MNIVFSFLAVSLLKDLKHANIVTLHDIVHTPKSLTLVFEYLVSVDCTFITVYYHSVATCIDVILLNVIDLDTVYWGFLPPVC